MGLTLTLHTDNDAFHPDPRPEVARLLREIATRLERGEDASHFLTVRDLNGNDVGRFRLTGDAR